MIINLKDIYQEIWKYLDKLYDAADEYGFDYDLVNNLSTQIDLLGKHFGIRKLKVDVPPFKKDEMVRIEDGVVVPYLTSLDRHDDRYLDIFYTPVEEIEGWFYE